MMVTHNQLRENNQFSRLFDVGIFLAISPQAPLCAGNCPSKARRQCSAQNPKTHNFLIIFLPTSCPSISPMAGPKMHAAFAPPKTTPKIDCALRQSDGSSAHSCAPTHSLHWLVRFVADSPERFPIVGVPFIRP